MTQTDAALAFAQGITPQERAALAGRIARLPIGTDPDEPEPAPRPVRGVSLGSGEFVLHAVNPQSAILHLQPEIPLVALGPDSVLLTHPRPPIGSPASLAAARRPALTGYLLEELRPLHRVPADRIMDVADLIADGSLPGELLELLAPDSQAQLAGAVAAIREVGGER